MAKDPHTPQIDDVEQSRFRTAPSPGLVARFVEESRADFNLPEALIEAVYRRLLLATDVVVDGGAHVGRHTRPLADICAEGQVIAYEALPHLALKLEESFARDANVVIRSKAIQNDPKLNETTFQFVADAPARSGITSSAINIADHLQFDYETLSVPATTIDSDLAALGVTIESVAFIKLDLEGGEFSALCGAQAVLQTAQPIVVFENNFFSGDVLGYTDQEMSMFFKSIGYERVTAFGQIVEDADFAYWYMFAAPTSKAGQLSDLLSELVEQMIEEIPST